MLSQILPINVFFDIADVFRDTLYSPGSPGIGKHFIDVHPIEQYIQRSEIGWSNLLH